MTRAASSELGERPVPAGERGYTGRVLDRYVVFDEIAAGGMATVHLGRLLGPAGFARTVAMKRLLPQFAREPEFLTMFLDEARLASRIRHPNVVSVLDVVEEDDDFFLVMDYIHGQSLGRLRKAQRGAVPARIALGVGDAILHGLHAAHEATGEDGAPLEIVHRDVSPQNVLVGLDGVARVVDFGIAKAAVRLQTTRNGQLKGKLPYMAPEQLRGEPATRRTDVYSAGVLLWEMLTGERLFVGENEAAIFGRVLEGCVPPPSAKGATAWPALDALVLRSLAREPARRFATAREMALALEDLGEMASSSEIGAWVERLVGADLALRGQIIRRIEHVARRDDALREARSAVRRRTRSAPLERAAPSTDLDGSVTSDAESASWELGNGSDTRQATAVPWGATASASPSAPGRARPRRIAVTLAILAIATIAAGWAAVRGLAQPDRVSCRVAVAPLVTRITAGALPSDDRHAGAASIETPLPSAAVSTPIDVGSAVRRAEASATPVTRPSRSTKPNASRPTPAAGSAPAPAPSCNPPWEFDASGTKRYKLECL